MATAFDVTSFIRREVGEISRMKLQKLLYYAQAWSLVWDGKPLFAETIEAWRNGPVVRDVWTEAQHGVGPQGDYKKLTAAERDTVRAIVNFYGKYDGETLSQVTHLEPPWNLARRNASQGAPSRSPVLLEHMKRYYGKIPTNGKVLPPDLEDTIRAMLSMDPDFASELAMDSMVDDDALNVDVMGHLRWLETGEGEPWPASSS